MSEDSVKYPFPNTILAGKGISEGIPPFPVADGSVEATGAVAADGSVF